MQYACRILFTTQKNVPLHAAGIILFGVCGFLSGLASSPENCFFAQSERYLACMFFSGKRIGKEPCLPGCRRIGPHRVFLEYLSES